MKTWVRATAWAGAVGFALVAGACNERGKRPETATSEAPRTLSGEEIHRVLIGNTLVGYDSTGPFWMYYPSTATLWGQASSGDVDVGGWRIEGNFYCRAWRRWLDRRERCWLLATDGSNRLLWITPEGAPDGASTVQSGNTIGQIVEARALAALAGADIEPAAGPPLDDTVIDGFGNRLAGRIGDSTEPGRDGIDGGTADNSVGVGSSGGSASSGASSGGDSGGTSGGDASGTTSGGDPSGDTSDDGDDGDGGVNGDNGGKGKGKGKDKDKDD